MKKELISVVIPTYNREDTILRAVNSVLNQTYKNWELIIIDDGSTDKTKKVLDPYLKDKRVSYFKTKNKGVCHARNFGIKKSKGKYIAFLDSDDEFLKGKLEIQLEEMKKNKAIFSLSNCVKIQGNKKISNILLHSFFIKKEDVIDNKIPLSASMMVFDKSLVKEVLFDEDLPTSNDFDFILRVFLKNKIFFVSKILNRIHKTLGENRISSDYSKKINGYRGVLRKLEGDIYKLNKNEKILLLKKLYSEIGFFEILNKDYEIGRSFLKKSFKIKDIKTKPKYRLVSLLSFTPFILGIVIKISKFLWKLGLLKN